MHLGALSESFGALFSASPHSPEEIIFLLDSYSKFLRLQSFPLSVVRVPE